MSVLQAASIKLADLIGHAGFSHPQCVRASGESFVAAQNSAITFVAQ